MADDKEDGARDEVSAITEQLETPGAQVGIADLTHWSNPLPRVLSVMAPDLRHVLTAARAELTILEVTRESRQRPAATTSAETPFALVRA